jgi:hypothetical protein
MAAYQFTIKFVGEGQTQEEAWDDAVAYLDERLRKMAHDDPEIEAEKL